MNERIQTLAGEALDQAMPQTWHNISPVDLDRILEKFAKLIAKECVGIVAKRKNQAIDDDWNVDEAMAASMFDIEDHFGVEE